MLNLNEGSVQQRLHHLALAREGTVCQPARSFLAAPHVWPSSTLRFVPSLSFPSHTKRSPFLVSNGSRWTASQWLDSTVQVEVPVPISLAWDLWSDREGLNRWMPWIHSIKISKEKPELSEWCLKYHAFGQDFTFKWTARNLQPIRYQKIHWRSVDGLPNRGTVRFYPRNPSSVGVQLTISFEVPGVLVPLATAVSPLVESVLQQDLERFKEFAKEQNLKIPVNSPER